MFKTTPHEEWYHRLQQTDRVMTAAEFAAWRDALMSDQKRIAFRAPIAYEVLSDPQLFGRLAADLLAGALGESAKACEGRAYTIDHARMTIAPHAQPFTDESDPAFIRNMLIAQLDLTITPAD